jgi:hypothetical protein
MLASLIAAFASGQFIAILRRTRRAAVAYILVALSATCGIGFLIGAAYIAAAERYGAFATALAFGFGFLVLACLILIAHRIATRVGAKRASRLQGGDFTTIAAASALALLPALLRGKGGIGAMIAPAAALIAYAIYRENRKPDDPPGE